MHNGKSRNKIRCSILAVQLNKLNVAAMATKGRHRVGLNEIVHRKPKRFRHSLATQPSKRTGCYCRRKAFEETETAAIREPSTSRNNSGEAPMMADHVRSRALVQHDRLLPDRRLRNRIILGNAIVWVTIVILISVIFF
jgi:hypothetical protein